MNFREALDEMMAGKLVARQEWKADRNAAISHLFAASHAAVHPKIAERYPDYTGHGVEMVTAFTGDLMAYPCLDRDIKADDWIVVGGPRVAGLDGG